MPTPSQAAPPLEQAGREGAHPGNAIRALGLALGSLTLWPLFAGKNRTAQERGRALIYLPAFGLLTGILLTLLDREIAGVLGMPMRSAVVIATSLLASGGLLAVGVMRTADALWRGRVPSAEPVLGLAGALAAVTFIALEALLLSVIAAPVARVRALLLANMLSRWAIVPMGYGLRPIGQSGLGIPWEGGIGFREFALSSVAALGVAMALYDLLALVVIVTLAATILLLRLLYSRRLGGVDGFGLAGAAALCELLTFVVLFPIPL